VAKVTRLPRFDLRDAKKGYTVGRGRRYSPTPLFGVCRSVAF